jgi:very-short-patch-repair endonuclease
MMVTYREINRLARKLRNNPTPAEDQLWRLVRKRQVMGFRFLRQHAIVTASVAGYTQFFIPDFYCAEAKAVIEVDGRIHRAQRDYDQMRERVLAEKGLRVLRIPNESLDDPASVLERIRDWMTKLPSSGQ